MTNEETDAALILEGELKRRVKEIIEKTVINMVGKVIHEELNKYKNEMLMEVCVAVGKTMRVAENENRKPLWEATPEEFGLTHEDLKGIASTSSRRTIEKDDIYALREQTPSV